MVTKASSIILVLICTVVTSSGQILLKIGSSALSTNLIKLITNYPLILGCIFYGVGAILLIAALKGGELSVLYPIFATNYIWVSILSTIFLNETMSTQKWAGILAIIIGVSVIGLGSRRVNNGN